MRKVALITPWPPQRTGIADYAFDLAIGLAQQRVEVVVFTDEEVPVPAGQGVQVRHVREFDGARQYDRVVYQMGNNPAFHSSVFLLLARHGGVVHLHDMVLHHLVAYYTVAQGRSHLYYRLLEHWYDSNVMQTVRAWNEVNRVCFWDSPRVTEIPLFDPVLRYAHGCIVHSEFCRQRVQARLPHLACAVIPQCYRDMKVVVPPSNRCFRIGVFGILQPHKHVDKVLRGVAHTLAQGVDVELDVAGSIEPGCEGLPGLAQELGIESRVHFHGRTEEAEFVRLMQSVDLCMALRYPTMGESSAVVSRCLQLGVPTVVSDVGWYAELPSVVQKIGTGDQGMQAEVNSLIFRHATDQQYHQAIREKAASHAEREFEFGGLAARYLRFLDAFPTQSPAMPSVEARQAC